MRWYADRDKNDYKQKVNAVAKCMYLDIEIRFVVIARGCGGESQLSQSVCRIFNIEYRSFRIAPNTIVFEHSVASNLLAKEIRYEEAIEELIRTSRPYGHRHPPLVVKPEESLHL